MQRWNALFSTATLMLVVSTVAAQQPASSLTALANPGPHGGHVRTGGDFQCEAVFSSKAIEVFVFDSAGRPVATRSARGRITLTVDGKPRSYRYDLYPRSGENAPTNALGVGIDLSRVRDRTANVAFALYGIAQQPVSFAAQFQRSLSPEQIAIGRQRICPVSGKPLGSMGAPPKVRVGNQDVYVCCVGCTNALKANPKLHLAKLPAPQPVKSTRADAAAIAKQRLCPIMGKPLDSMGVPWKVTVKGQRAYVCCKGCIKKVEKHPDESLRKVARFATNGRVVR